MSNVKSERESYIPQAISGRTRPRAQITYPWPSALSIEQAALCPSALNSGTWA